VNFTRDEKNPNLRRQNKFVSPYQGVFLMISVPET